MRSLKSSADLNLIVVLDALLRHQNVSKAARELNLTQSAISHALSRLRDQFRDPLFVRVGRGIVPSQFALSIQPDVTVFIDQARHLTKGAEEFKPSLAKGRIVISSTDYFEAVAGPQIYAKLQKEAPGVQLAFRPASGTFPKDLLESGECDLAVGGYFREIPTSFYKQKLFADPYEVCFRKGHPYDGKKLTERMYYQAGHTRLTLKGNFQDQFTDARNGKTHHRNFRYGSGNFSNLLLIVCETDLLLTAPAGLLKIYEKHVDIRVHRCPVDVKPLEIEMVWHALKHQNPLNQWVRTVIKDVCNSLS